MYNSLQVEGKLPNQTYLLGRLLGCKDVSGV